MRKVNLFQQAFFVPHDIPRLVDSRGDLEAEALIEGDGAGVAGEDIQQNGLGGGGTALLDDGSADALILEGWKEIEVVQFQKAVFVAVKVVEARLLAVGMDNRVLTDGRFDLPADPAQDLGKVDGIQLLVLLDERFAEQINLVDVFGLGGGVG